MYVSFNTAIKLFRESGFKFLKFLYFLIFILLLGEKMLEKNVSFF